MPQAHDSACHPPVVWCRTAHMMASRTGSGSPPAARTARIASVAIRVIQPSTSLAFACFDNKLREAARAEGLETWPD